MTIFVAETAFRGGQENAATLNTSSPSELATLGAAGNLLNVTYTDFDSAVLVTSDFETLVTAVDALVSPTSTDAASAGSSTAYWGDSFADKITALEGALGGVDLGTSDNTPWSTLETAFTAVTEEYASFADGTRFATELRGVSSSPGGASVGVVQLDPAGTGDDLTAVAPFVVVYRIDDGRTSEEVADDLAGTDLDNPGPDPGPDPDPDPEPLPPLPEDPESGNDDIPTPDLIDPNGIASRLRAEDYTAVVNNLIDQINLVFPILLDKDEATELEGPLDANRERLTGLVLGTDDTDLINLQQLIESDLGIT